MANRVIAKVSAVWNTVDRLHELPTRTRLKSSQKQDRTEARRIADEGLPAWYAAVQTLSSVRRDLQLFVLFTALRSADARTVRWEDVDLKRAALKRPTPKGGAAKAFELPLPKTCIEVLEGAARRMLATFPHTEVMPDGCSRVSPGRSPFRVIALAEPKQLKTDKTTKQRVLAIPGLHTLAQNLRFGRV